MKSQPLMPESFCMPLPIYLARRSELFRVSTAKKFTRSSAVLSTDATICEKSGLSFLILILNQWYLEEKPKEGAARSMSFQSVRPATSHGQV